jgi:mono/diheme cytochrome c family protein
MLTLNLFKVPELSATIQAAQAAGTARGVQEIGRQILQPANSLTFAGRAGGRGGTGGLSAEVQATLQRGATIYTELCSTCHGADGRGTSVDGAPMLGPALIGSNRVQGHRDYVIKTLLHGLTGTIDGRTYAGGVMVPMGANTDEWVATIGSYIRSGFGTTGWRITPADVARVRAANADRKTPWTVSELEASLPRLLVPDPTWKATASHNPAAASAALNFSGWSSAVPQEAGMWLQIELPSPVSLTEIQFDSPPAQAGNQGGSAAPARYPRGYRVQVSADGQRWSPPVAEGEGTSSTTTIIFKPVRAKFVRITQTAAAASLPLWFVRSMRLFHVP